MIIGYTIPGSRRGQALTLPDWCYRKVTEADACRIADEMRRALGHEPTWQAVRGALIRMAKQRNAAA